MRAPLFLLTLSLTILGGCESLSLPTPLGGQCELTSQCDAPLVCRLEYCRKECATSRDCGAGLNCVLDNAGLGACQLPEERRCDRDSDCPSFLVCRMSQCTNECACMADQPCPDCPPGAECLAQPEGGNACIDSSIACTYASRCPDGLVCVEGRCRPECRSGLDCLDDETCVTRTFMDEPTDGATSMTRACRCELQLLVDQSVGYDPCGM